MKTTLKKVETGLTFSVVAQMLGGGMANVCSYIAEKVQTFIRENGLAEVPHVLMADHSVGGRKWTRDGENEALYFAEKGFNGGWYIFKEEDVSRLFLESATSGSTLTAEKCKDSTWTVTLEVPFDEDGPYQGAYWSTFHLQDEAWKPLMELSFAS